MFPQVAWFGSDWGWVWLVNQHLESLVIVLRWKSYKYLCKVKRRVMFGKGRERSDPGLCGESHSYLKILVDGKLRGGAVSILVLLLLRLCCKGRGWKNLNAHHHSQRKRWGNLLWEWANSSRGADYPGSYSWSQIREKISCLMPVLYKNIGREWLFSSH